MIAARFFHKYKRPSDCLSHSEQAEKYRQDHQANFRGLPGFLDELVRNPGSRSAGTRIAMNPDRQTACVQFAQWMTGCDAPSGNEVKNSLALGTLCRALDELIQTGLRDMHWAHLDIAWFDDVESDISSQNQKMVYCRYLTMARALAEVLTRITGIQYSYTDKCRDVRMAMKNQIGILRIKTGFRTRDPEASFFSLFADNEMADITAFPAPVSLAEVLSGQGTGIRDT